MGRFVLQTLQNYEDRIKAEEEKNKATIRTQFADD